MNGTIFFKPKKTVYVKIMLKIFNDAQNRASHLRFSSQDPSKNLTFFKRYWLVLRAGPSTMNRQQNDEVLNANIQNLQGQISYKFKTLLFAAELSITDLFIHNIQSSNEPSNFGMSATVKRTKLWPSKCTWHHDCVWFPIHHPW